MSSSSWSTDGSSDEGWGYADDVVASPSSSSGLSASSSLGSPDRREIVYEDIELNVDNSRVWSELVPPPTM